MKLTWEQTKVGYVAKINGIAVAQASEAFFNTYYSITMLLPFDGVERKFATLQDAQAFIVADLLHTINLLIRWLAIFGICFGLSVQHSFAPLLSIGVV